MLGGAAEAKAKGGGKDETADDDDDDDDDASVESASTKKSASNKGSKKSGSKKSGSQVLPRNPPLPWDAPLIVLATPGPLQTQETQELGPRLTVEQSLR